MVTKVTRIAKVTKVQRENLPPSDDKNKHISKYSRDKAAFVLAIIITLLLTTGGGAAVAYRFALNEDPAITSSVNLMHIGNFRTVTVPGVIKRDVLFRSEKLYAVPDSDVKRLERLLKGGLVVDLREKRERSSFPDKHLSGVKNENYPVDGTQDYTKFVSNANSRQQFGRALTDIASTKGNVLVHCNLGKDRTGWLVAMLMYAVGADRTEIVKEYMRSHRQVLTNGDTITVQKQWLRNGVNAASKKYGSLDNYLRHGLGVTDDTLKKLRDKFTLNSA